MVYQPRKKPSRNHEYHKPLRERRKEKKRTYFRKERLPEVVEINEREIFEVTLTRLQTLGNQRFLSSPYSNHYNRWVANIENILTEFESHPKVSLNEQYIIKRTKILANIKLQLEERQKKEATIEAKNINLLYHKNNLKSINAKYAAMMNIVKLKHRRQIKLIDSQIERLKNEQEEAIRIKTGFLFRVSKRSREQKEAKICQQITETQRNLELLFLEYIEQKNKLKQDFEKKREPVMEEIKKCQREVSEFEVDGSLEDRWFCCQGLIDCLANLIQRESL